MSLFGDADQSLNVTIKAKDEASAVLNKVRLSVGDIAKGAAIGELAVRGLSMAFNALENVATASLQEYQQWNSAVAQTNAVLESTRHAAGLTSTEIIGLSKTISNNTLYQDDMVLSAENMLLTFTNITKDIFPETTQAVLDMSTALGQDLSSSAIQLGKALNDPINGVSALQRVGVTFSNAQQEMIATMVKSGNTMEAQRYILAELNKEFGGSAQSAYESASSVVKLQKSVKDLEQDIGSGLTPALNNLFTAFANTTSGMGKNVDIGLLVFKAFTNIEEAAVALGNALIQPVLGLAKMKAEAASFLDSISLFSAEEKSKRIQGDKDQIASLNDLSDKSSDFLDNLVAANEDVIASWGQSSDAVETLGKVGPAAYQATAEEAKAAADQIKKTQQAIADTKKTLDDYKKDLQGETDNVAQLFADQEKTVHDAAVKVQEARKQYDDAQTKLGENPNDQNQQENVVTANTALNDALAELKKQSDALNNASTIRQQLPDQVANAERRNNETDFERNLEDVFKRVNDKGADFAQNITYQITFGDAVVGDAGIKKVITDAITAINRQAALSGVAGR
jgi:phage-related minor tail protein